MAQLGTKFDATGDDVLVNIKYFPGRKTKPNVIVSFGDDSEGDSDVEVFTLTASQLNSPVDSEYVVEF